MSRSVACAVIHDDPPQVLVAEDLETLHWVLALKLIAATPARDLPVDVRDQLRDALLDERWSDAVLLWMHVHAGVVDVYPSHDLYEPRDVEVGGAELQFRPLFAD